MHVERPPMRGLGWEPQRAGAAAGTSSSSLAAIAWYRPGSRGHQTETRHRGRKRRPQDNDSGIAITDSRQAAAGCAVRGPSSLLLTASGGHRCRPARAAGEARCLDLSTGHFSTQLW